MGKKIFLILSIIALTIIVGASFVLLNFKKPQGNTPVTENKSDIEVFSPKPNETISSPVKITGVARGNGWSGFEGQVGVVLLLDSSGSELARGVLSATTEWTQLPTNFETTLTFSALGQGTGSLVFHNENPSGMPERDKTFTLPVTLK